MSFFGDLKRVTKATAGAVGKGVELLAYGAEELNKSSEVMLLKANCYKLETELRNLKNRNSDASEIRLVRDKLLEAYRVAIPSVSDFDRKDISSKIKCLLEEKGRDELGEVVDRVKFKTRALEKPVGFSPSVKISRLESLRADYNLIVDIARKLEDANLVLDAKNKMDQIDSEIPELEKLRHEVVTHRYSSGAMKSIVRKYDGILQGVSEYWYETGELWKRLSYHNGFPSGSCTLLRKDGSTLIEIDVDRSSSRIIQKVYLGDGKKVLDGYVSRGRGELSVWLWNGVFWARLNIVTAE